MIARIVRTVLVLTLVLMLTPVESSADDWLDGKTVAELNNLLKIYFNQGQQDSALIIAKRAVKKATDEYGAVSDEVAVSLHGQATLLYSTGYAIPARPLYERALSIWSSVPPSDTVVFGASKYNLAVIHIESGRFASAVILLRDALNLLTPLLDPNDPNLAGVYFDMAEAYRLSDVHDSAIVYYREALTRQQASLGKYDLQVARTWNNLGLSLAAKEQFSEAEDAYNKALTSLERVLGADDLEVGFCIENLVSMYVKTGKNDAAGRLAGLARGIFEKRLGVNSLEALEITYLQGIISHRKKDYPAAETTYRDVRSRLRQLDSTKSNQLTMRVLTSLEELFLETGQSAKASEIQKEIETVRRQTSG